MQMEGLCAIRESSSIILSPHVTFPIERRGLLLLLILQVITPVLYSMHRLAENIDINKCNPFGEFFSPPLQFFLSLTKGGDHLLLSLWVSGWRNDAAGLWLG